MGVETAALVLSWFAIALLGLAMAGLMRQVQWLTAGGRSLQHVGPTVGSHAPALPGINYASASRTVAVFLADDCPLCERLGPEAEALALATSGQDMRIVVARVGSDRADDPASTLISEQQLRQWRVSVTPFAVHVGSDARVVDAGPVESLASLRALVGPHEVRREVTA